MCLVASVLGRQRLRAISPVPRVPAIHILRLAKGETVGHMAESMSLSVKTIST